MSWAPGRARSVRRTVTFTPEEWERVRTNYELARDSRGYTSFAGFVRDLATTGSTRAITVFTDPAQLRGEIRRIGNNINQITHQANLTGTINNAQLDAVAARMDELNRLLADMFADYTASRTDGRWA